MAQTRDARLITKRTSVPGKIPTGTTGNELNFIKSGELASNLADHNLWGYDGTDVFEYGSNSFLGLSGGTVSGNLFVNGNFSASTLYSGSTDVETIIYNILAGAPSSDITRVQPGTNTTTGGTANNPTVNLVSSPSINGLSFSGTATGNILSANTISATTASILSSGLRLRNPANTFHYTIVPSAIVANRNVTIPLLTGNDTFVTAAFAQTLTNKTLTSPVINTQISGTVTSGGNITATNFLVGATAAQTITNKTINATNNTITDTSTVLGDLFKSNGTKFVRFAKGTSLQHLRVNVGGTDLEWANEDITRVQPGTNIQTGGTANTPTISTVASPSFNNIGFSGTVTGGDIFSVNLSATTIYSGGTNIETIISNIAGPVSPKIKSGIIPSSGFTGNPDKAIITFTTAFSDNNYSVVVTGEDSRTWTIESKSSAGFTVNSNSNTNPDGDTFWQAVATGEN